MGFLSDIPQPKSITGVEVVQTGDGHIYHYAVLERKKGSLDVVNSSMSIESLDRLFEKIPKDIPVSLCLNIRGVIHRELDMSAKSETRNLMNRVLPDANERDFLLQDIPTLRGRVVSLSRKDLAEEWMGKFDDAGYWVLGLGLGAYPVHALMPFVRERSYSTHTHNFVFNDENLLAESSRESDSVSSRVLLGDDRLESHLLPAAAVAFRGLLGKGSFVDSESVSLLRKEYRNRWWFNTMGTTGLVLILLLLLASFLIGNRLKEENRNLAGQLSLKESQLEKMDVLKSRIAQYGKGGGTRPSRTSFHADRLAMTVPGRVRLEWLEIHPMEGEDRDYAKGDIINYEEGIIYVKGISDDSANYNEWLEKLRKEDWVADEEHIGYEDGDDGVGEFELRIIIK